jgi:hypothetical protein
MRWKREGCAENYIIKGTMPFPELAIEVMVSVLGRCSVKMVQITAKQTCKEDDCAIRGQRRRAVSGKDVGE